MDVEARRPSWPDPLGPSGITGQVIYVDAGYCINGDVSRAVTRPASTGLISVPSAWASTDSHPVDMLVAVGRFRKAAFTCRRPPPRSDRVRQHALEFRPGCGPRLRRRGGGGSLIQVCLPAQAAGASMRSCPPTHGQARVVELSSGLGSGPLSTPPQAFIGRSNHDHGTPRGKRRTPGGETSDGRGGGRVRVVADHETGRRSLCRTASARTGTVVNRRSPARLAVGCWPDSTRSMRFTAVWDGANFTVKEAPSGLRAAREHRLGQLFKQRPSAMRRIVDLLQSSYDCSRAMIGLPSDRSMLLCVLLRDLEIHGQPRLGAQQGSIERVTRVETGRARALGPRL